MNHDIHETEHTNEHEHHHGHHHEEFEVHPCDGAGHEHHHHEDGTCCCEQHAKEFHGIQKPMLIRLIVAAVCYLAGMILPVGETVELILMLACALLAGYDVILGAVRNIAKGHFFDEYFLMSFAAIAAFVIGEYEEAAAVFLLYRIGAFCQAYAIRHSRKTIAGMTGDEHHHGDEDHSSNEFIQKFARVYTPIILIMAVLIAVFLPIVSSATFHDAMYRALTFLVLACPCAIVISVPLAYFAGISAASKKSIYFHNTEAVEALAKKNSDVAPIHTMQSDSGETLFACEVTEGDKKCIYFKNLADLQIAMEIAKKTRVIAHENIWFTIAVKVAVLILSVCGISALWFAVFADSGVTIVVVLNALRAFRAKGKF